MDSLSRFLRVKFKRKREMSSTTTLLDNSKVRIYRSGKDSIPQHPGPHWTRFVLISDTHSRTGLQVPDGDILIHAGDLSSYGTPSQLKVCHILQDSLL